MRCPGDGSIGPPLEPPDTRTHLSDVASISNDASRSRQGERDLISQQGILAARHKQAPAARSLDVRCAISPRHPALPMRWCSFDEEPIRPSEPVSRCRLMKCLSGRPSRGLVCRKPPISELSPTYGSRISPRIRVRPIRRTPRTEGKAPPQLHPRSPLATSRFAFLVLALGSSVPPTSLESATHGHAGSVSRRHGKASALARHAKPGARR